VIIPKKGKKFQCRGQTKVIPVKNGKMLSPYFLVAVQNTVTAES